MKKKNITLLLAGALALSLAGAADAASLHWYEQVNLKVDFDWDDGQLDVDLEGPLSQFVSFDGVPQSNEQNGELTAAQNTLYNPANIFSLNPEAQCTVTDMEVKPDFHYGKRFHKPSEMEADVELACRDLSAVKRLNVELFKHFPGIKQVNVIVEGTFGNKLLTVTPQSSSVDF